MSKERKRMESKVIVQGFSNENRLVVSSEALSPIGAMRFAQSKLEDNTKVAYIVMLEVKDSLVLKK